jgi:hypothetical protein
MVPDAKEFNRAVIDRLKGSGPPVTSCGEWYADFVALPEDVVETVFGTAGVNLQYFLGQMDLKHPDLRDNVEERIFNSHSSTTFGSMVGLVKLAIDSNKKELLPALSQVDFIPRDLYEQADTERHIRCLKDAVTRQEYRKNKKSQAVDTATFSRRGEEIWNMQPASFVSLMRYEKAYDEEVKAAKHRAKRFRDLGCVAMAGEVMKSVELFESQLSDSYLGFNRLTFNSALVILAKWHKYDFTAPYILSAWPTERNYRILVPARYFADYDFFEKSEEQAMCWNYSPRIYPLADLEPLTPDMKEIIGLCEEHPQYGNRPLFDHYVVMLPGVDYPSFREKSYTFRSDTGSLTSFDDYNKARHSLDRTLLHAGAFSGVVMGERDGKCYFISVWS